jgi:hypothetical protein
MLYYEHLTSPQAILLLVKVKHLELKENCIHELYSTIIKQLGIKGKTSSQNPAPVCNQLH